MDAAKYDALCEAHDWFYDWSDDGAVWRRGNDYRKMLLHIAAGNPELEAIFGRHYEKFRAVVDVDRVS